jgi:preprotein translocase SecE subunit
VARNRKRTRDRRPRRPDSRSALATTNGEPVDTGEAELAEAQLALGRPELTEVPDEEELEELAEEAVPSAVRGGRSAASVELGEPGGAPPAHREPAPSRLVNFLRGSWRELQRVQWPDRRQVFQATGVVIGFVIVAGVFLGVADVVSQKVVNLILYGHG